MAKDVGAHAMKIDVSKAHATRHETRPFGGDDQQLIARRLFARRLQHNGGLSDMDDMEWRGEGGKHERGINPHPCRGRNPRWHRHT